MHERGREAALMRVEAKLEELGLVLPEAPKLPPGVQVSFAWVRVYKDRAYIAGQGPLNPDGSIAQPLEGGGGPLSGGGLPSGALICAYHPRQPKARVGRPRPNNGLAYGLRLG